MKNEYLNRVNFVLLMMCFAIGLHSQAWKEDIKKKNPDFFTIKAAFEKASEGKDITTIPGWKKYKRWEWFMESRVNDAGYLDSMKLWEAIKVKKKRFAGSKTVTSDWREIGPRNIPSNDSMGGLGRINCITFDPADSDTIWVGCPSGGLWKTTDGGSNWSTNTDDLPNIGISWVLIDPGNSDIMYIASGDADGVATYSLGVLKSTDGGDNWSTTGLQASVLNGMLMRKMLFQPGNSNTIIVAADDGIYKTTDAAATWTKRQSGEFKDIEVNASSPNIWYAAAYGDGIYKSTDSGNSWTKVNTGLPTADFNRIELDISESTPSTIYALYSGKNWAFHGLYRSTDSGSTWTEQATSPNLLGWEYTGSDSRGQGYYDLTLAVNPTNADEVYVGGVNIWKSGDAGVSWNCIADWLGHSGSTVHADHHYMEFLPGSSSVLFSGNDGGIFKSTDSGTTWSNISNGLGIHQIYHMGGSQSLEADIIVGTQDTGSTLLTNGAGVHVLGGDGKECAIDPEDSNTIYCSTQSGNIFRSTNHGLSFFLINDGLDNGSSDTPFQIAPEDHETLYIATRFVYKSTNRGTDWTPISPALTDGKLGILAVAPSNSDYIYAAATHTIFATGNGGVSWTNLSRPTVPAAKNSHIAVDPETPTTVWLTCRGYAAGEKVFRSTNGGSTWTNISGSLPNIPVNCIVVDHTCSLPNKPVYIGTDLGVFISQEGTGNWEAFDTGLPNVIVNELEIHTSSRKLRAATFGRGMWESPLAAVGEDINITRPTNGVNWSAGTSRTISWTSNDVTGTVTIALYKGDSLDSTIATADVSSGSYSWAIPPGQPSGSDYKIRIYQGSVSDYSSDFSIYGGTGAEISLSRRTLSFGAVGTTVTSAQNIYLNNSGSGSLIWTATSDQSWLNCTPDSGSNSGVLRVSVDPAGLSTGTHTGTLTVSDALASNSPVTVAVSLKVCSPGSTIGPFGQFSTPVDGSSVSSSIAVTGWVLDDMGVDNVKIYSGDTYIGDAIFVEGARTDIEQEYPTHPGNYKAGWGYMLLTNFLPGGGNGVYTLNAYVTDIEGNIKSLGTKTITVDNENAVKPFGAIDTPAQGGSASGTFYSNRGWALTPQPNKIPEDGSTIDVYVDGVFLGNPRYNLHRSDVITLFPGYANSSGPAADFDLELSGYANGVHTIYWVAADDGGNADGIGSRFFTVQNTGNIAPAESLSFGHSHYSNSQAINPASLPGIPALSSPIGVITGYAKDSTPRIVHAKKNGVVTIRVKELERVVVIPDYSDVTAHSELNDAKLTRFPTSGHQCKGYLVAGKQLRALPTGSTLDAERGVFYWHPGPGFVGIYKFLFIMNKNGKRYKQEFQVEIEPGF
ncbi:MAG: hypothetical protein GY757_08495 [bacterium]|nr:hypothetical protein [bacterium]